MLLDTPIMWPRSLLPPQGWSGGMDPQVQAGGRLTASGRLAVNRSPTRGLWRPALVDIPVWEQGQRDMVMALQAYILGRGRSVLVPFFHGGFGPWTADAGHSTLGAGATIVGRTLEAPRAVALVSQAGDAGDTIVKVNKVDCGEIRIGHTFSIGYRLYTVSDIISQTNGAARVEVAPELREDIAAGDWLEFTAPHVICRMLNPAALAMEWRAPFHTLLTAQFIEDTEPVE